MISSNTNNRFDLISEAGGVIDVKKAAEYAYTNYYKASTAKATPQTKVIKKAAPKKPVYKKK
jgi:hypothetical protein